MDVDGAGVEASHVAAIIHKAAVPGLLIATVIATIEPNGVGAAGRLELRGSSNT